VTDQPPERGTPQPAEPVPPRERTPAGDGEGGRDYLDPAKLLRIAGVVREVLEEARRIRPQSGALDHLQRVHDQISAELRQSLPEDLYRELDDLTPEIRDGTLEELALAHAEILGWLEGLFQGTQLAIRAQAANAAGQLQRQMEEAAHAGLPEGARPGQRPDGEEPGPSRGTYL